MKTEALNALNKLKSLDLSKYPYKDILKQINDLGSIGSIEVTLGPTKPIFRARPNEDDGHFISKCQLTYKPQQFNKTYQRASTPQMTMFYGSFLPSNLEPGDMDSTVVAPIYEAVPWMRDKNTKGIKKVTFSKWSVTKELNLIAILQHGNYYDKSSYTTKLMDEFKKFLDQNPDNKEETIAFTTYLSSEFAKEVDSKDDFNYLISAAYTELVIDGGYDGVLYPSVKVDGSGFNIALTPVVADTKLRLDVVVESSVYKYFDKAVMDYDYQVLLYNNQTHFELEKIEDEYHSGADECLKQLGLNSLKQLI